MLNPNLFTALYLTHREWGKYLRQLPAPLVLQGLLSIQDEMSDREFWEVLRDAWIYAEYPRTKDRNTWLRLFQSARPQREHLMRAEDHAILAKLPNLVRLYRGAHPRYRRGMSWTTDLERAIWFSELPRLRPNDLVFSTWVAKAEILAFFGERKESEAVIDPRWRRIEEV